MKTTDSADRCKTKLALFPLGREVGRTGKTGY
jgi:hypothetical protein